MNRINFNFKKIKMIEPLIRTQSLIQFSFLYTPFSLFFYVKIVLIRSQNFHSIFIFSAFLWSITTRFMQKAENFSFFVTHKHTVKHMIPLCIPKLLQKKFYFFSLQCIRMIGKNINFDDKKIKKVTFIKTKK